MITWKEYKELNHVTEETYNFHWMRYNELLFVHATTGGSGNRNRTNVNYLVDENNSYFVDENNNYFIMV